MIDIDWKARALQAEAERDKAVKERARLETQKDILWAGLNDAKVHIERVEAERDQLTAKLDAVKRYVKRVPFPKADKMLAILADTDEPHTTPTVIHEAAEAIRAHATAPFDLIHPVVQIDALIAWVADWIENPPDWVNVSWRAADTDEGSESNA